MKKLLSIIIALVTFAGMADAQITIKKSDTGKAERMTTLSMYWSWIYRLDDAYFLVMKSSNQFDDSFWMNLGTNQEECMESVNALIDLAKTITDTDRYELGNGVGDTYDVTRYNDFGAKGLRFDGESHAGFGYIILANLNKAAKWIQTNIE